MKYNVGDVVEVGGTGVWYGDKEFTPSTGKIIDIDEGTDIPYLVDFTFERKTDKETKLVHLDNGFSSDSEKIGWFREEQVITKCSDCKSDKVYHDVKEKYLCPWCEL